MTISTSAWIGCEVPFKRTDVFHQIASVPGRSRRFVPRRQQSRDRGRLSAVAARRRSGTGDGATVATPTTRSSPRSPRPRRPGSGGVLFTPWLNGERSPVEDRTLRAAFLNISMTTERAHLVRAVLEGVAFNARWLLDAVERFIKRPMPVLRILGGGAVSDLWCQIHADILDRRIERVADPMYANLRGAAFFAAMSLGRHRACRRRGAGRASTATFEPEPRMRGRCTSRCTREYRRLYHRLHGVYARLNA